MGVAGIIAGGSAVLGAGTSILGSSQAAGAAKDAAGVQARQYAQTRADLAPYNEAGQSVLGDLTSLAKSGPYGGGPNYISQAAGMQPGQMSEAELQATPGYQFTLGRGLNAVANAAAAKGLGVSGAALKGAGAYATGLADSTYQNQFNNAQTRFQNAINLNTAQQGNLTNQYNRLQGAASLGENAAATTGKAGTDAAASQGNYLNAAGQAQAAGTVGVGSAATGAANNYLSNNLLTQLINRGGGYFGQSGPGSNVVPVV